MRIGLESSSQRLCSCMSVRHWSQRQQQYEVWIVFICVTVFVFSMHGCREEWQNDPFCLNEPRLASWWLNPAAAIWTGWQFPANGAQAGILAGGTSLELDNDYSDEMGCRFWTWLWEHHAVSSLHCWLGNILDTGTQIALWVITSCRITLIDLLIKSNLPLKSSFVVWLM